MENRIKTEIMVLKNKIILVTGAAGFIGANLVLELLKEDKDIHIMMFPLRNIVFLRLKRRRLNVRMSNGLS